METGAPASLYMVPTTPGPGPTCEVIFERWRQKGLAAACRVWVAQKLAMGQEFAGWALGQGLCTWEVLEP
jgi:hypothetical protein